MLGNVDVTVGILAEKLGQCHEFTSATSLKHYIIRLISWRYRLGPVESSALLESRTPPPANWNWRRVPNSSRNTHISATGKRHLAEGGSGMNWPRMQHGTNTDADFPDPVFDRCRAPSA